MAVYSAAAVLPSEICSATAPAEYSVEITVDFQAYTPTSDAPTVFDVLNPHASWRATLPQSGKMNLSDCQVMSNTTSKVSIACGNKSTVGMIQIFAGGAASKYTFESQPNSFSPPPFAGDKVIVSGAQLNLHPYNPVIVEAGNGGIKAKNIVTNASVTLNSSATTKLACEISGSGGGAIVLGGLPGSALPPGGSKVAPQSIQLLGTSVVSASLSNLMVDSKGCLLPSVGADSFGNLTIQPFSGSSTSPRLITNWQTFNVGGSAAVTFNQPTASSGGGTIVISGGGLTTNGAGGSSNGGITIGGKSGS